MSEILLALNAATIAMQSALSRDNIYLAMSTELMKLNIESTVFLYDHEQGIVEPGFISYNPKTIKAVESILGLNKLVFDLNGIPEFLEVIQQRKAIFVKDPKAFIQHFIPLQYQEITPKIMRMLSISNIIISPIIYKDSVKGIFILLSSLLTEIELPAVTMFTYHLAGSWYRGELFEQYQKENAARLIAEDELLDTGDKYQNIINWSPVGIYHSSKEGKIIAANTALAQMLGYDNERELINHTNMYDLYVDTNVRTKYLDFHSVKGDEALKNIELNWKKKDGTHIWVLLTAHAIYDDNHNILYYEGFVQDIEKQKQANLALENSISQFIATLDSTNDGILVVDLQGTVTNFNKRFTDLWRIPIEMLENRDDNQLLKFVLDYVRNPSDFIDRVNHIYSLADHDSFDVVELADDRVFERYSHPQLLDNKPIGRVWSFRDVTDRNRSVESLKETQLQYSSVVDNSNDTIVIYQEEKICFVNAAVTRLLGYSTDDFVNKSLLDFIVEVDKERIYNNYLNLAHKDIGSSICELMMINLQGHPVPVEFNVSNILYKGKPAGLVFIRDISDRKKAEKEIHDREFWLSQSQKFARIGSYYLDIFSGEWKCTETLDLIFGIPSDHPKNIKTWSSIIYEEDRQSMMDYFVQQVLTNKQPFDREYRIQRRNDDKIMWVHGRGDLTLNENGDPIAMLGTIIDIHERRMMEDELTLAKERAEESSRLKTSLLLNISHELRTPMNGILGFAEILSEAVQDPVQKRMADNILFSGNRLQATLDSIVDLSQVQADTTLMRIEPINVIDELKVVISNFNDVARSKNIRIEASIPDELIAFADQKLIKNVFHHLIDNALKFTDKGYVKVNASLDETGEWAVLSVKDTGIGIADENLEMIFEEFRQVSEGMGRSYEGTGIGLTLCQKFVNLMKGSVTVESELGIGSVFTVKLPLKGGEWNYPGGIPKVLKDEPKVEPLPTASLPLVLLVEDQEYNIELIEIYLTGICETDRAFDGMSAVKMAFTRQYDAILMDVNLGPGIDGLEATRRIRSIKGYEKVPVIAVTGYSTTSEKEHILANGCTHYLSKPYNKNNLIKIIKEALS